MREKLGRLTIYDFQKLGVNDHNAIMSLRIKCSTRGSYFPQRGSHEVIIRKILLQNLIEECLPSNKFLQLLVCHTK